MCRLFGLSAAPARITATFWLAEAPDSLTAQSHREPDGVGLGYFRPDGTPALHKRPIANSAALLLIRSASPTCVNCLLPRGNTQTHAPLLCVTSAPYIDDP